MNHVQAANWLRSPLLWLSQDFHNPDSIHVSALPVTPNEAIEAAKAELQRVIADTEFTAIRALQKALDTVTAQATPEGQPDAGANSRLRIADLTRQVEDREQSLKRKDATIQRLNRELEQQRLANHGNPKAEQILDHSPSGNAESQHSTEGSP